jgi:hypothetical protein
MTRDHNTISRWKRLPSPAMIVAVAALVTSAGGTVTAAALITSAGIKDNTIRSVDVRDGTLRGVDVRAGTLTGADVKDGRLKGLDVANNSLTGADIAESTLGQVPSAANAANAANATNAGTVDGWDANSLIRVARMTTANPLTLTTMDQTYGGNALSLTAPAPGFVMIHGGTSIFNNGCTTGCAVNARIRHIQSGQVSAPAQESIAAGQSYANTAHAFVFPVNAGLNTFDIRIHRNIGNGVLAANYAELAAIYTPFGSAGEGPAD